MKDFVFVNNADDLPTMLRGGSAFRVPIAGPPRVARPAAAIARRPVPGTPVAQAPDLQKDIVGALTRLGGRISALEDSAKTSTREAAPVWSSFGEFLQAVHRAAGSANSRIVDPRLVHAALGSNENVPSEGGFLVPFEFAPLLMTLVAEQSLLAPLCMQVPLSKGNRGVFPALDEQSRANGSRFGGIVSTWQNEADALVASKATFRSATLILGKLTAAIYASEELMDDSALLGAFMSMAFPLEAAYRLDEAIIGGPGAGQPLGILNSPALITVAKDAGQPAATITPQNLRNMFGRMLPECRRNCVWLLSPEIEEQLYALATGNAGQAVLLFTPADEQAPYGRLMNRPILPVEQCSNIGTFGDIILADLSRYLIVTKPLKIALSIHVRFVQGEGLYKMVYRVDGQSAIRTAITSYNGGPTKSAFVALAAR